MLLLAGGVAALAARETMYPSEECIQSEKAEALIPAKYAKNAYVWPQHVINSRSSEVNVSLPRTRDFGDSVQQYDWVASGSGVPSAVYMPVVFQG